MKKLTLLAAGLIFAAASFAAPCDKDKTAKAACCKGKAKTECKKEVAKADCKEKSCCKKSGEATAKK